jgi:hypothetical protein
MILKRASAPVTALAAGCDSHPEQEPMTTRRPVGLVTPLPKRGGRGGHETQAEEFRRMQAAAYYAIAANPQYTTDELARTANVSSFVVDDCLARLTASGKTVQELAEQLDGLERPK